MRIARRMFGLALVAVSLVGLAAPGTASAAVTTAQKQQILYQELGSSSFFNTMYANRGVSPYNTFDWSTDLCSWSPDKPLGFDFTGPCRRHDFNYRNFKANGIWSATNKAKIDTSFNDDMHAVCAKQNIFKRPACLGLANTYYAFVKKLGT